MLNLTWLTDIHLNFLNEDERKIFYQNIAEIDSTAVLISGDIAEASSVNELLMEMANQIDKPIYFVLGNHDYYRGNVKEVRASLTSLTKENNRLFWLPAAGIQTLNSTTILLGQDGWADGRFGDYNNSSVSLNDSRMIRDLFQAKIFGKFKLLDKMQELADDDAIKLEKNLTDAITQCPKNIIVITHVPPFKESCMHEGKISGDDWLPYFSSKIMGDVLTRIANANPFINFLVLCGHTHSEALFQPFANLTIKAGKAEYYRPIIQELITIA